MRLRVQLIEFKNMSDLDQAIKKLERLEADYRNEKRIRWIDIGLHVFWMLSWVLVWWVWRPFAEPSFTESRWTDFLMMFALYIGSALAIFSSRLILDYLFKTGRKSSFRSYFASLAISTLVLVAIFTILIFAASKTADLIF